MTRERVLALVVGRMGGGGMGARVGWLHTCMATTKLDHGWALSKNDIVVLIVSSSRLVCGIRRRLINVVNIILLVCMHTFILLKVDICIYCESYRCGKVILGSVVVVNACRGKPIT